MVKQKSKKLAKQRLVKVKNLTNKKTKKIKGNKGLNKNRQTKKATIKPEN